MRKFDMITIERASNGFIVRHITEGDSEVVVVSDENKSDPVVFRDLVLELSEMLGFYGNKYDAERFYAVIAPGLDNPEYRGLDFAHWGHYHEREEKADESP